MASFDFPFGPGRGKQAGGADTTPLQGDRQLTEQDFSRERVRDWVGKLPLGDSTRACQALLQRISACNRMDLQVATQSYFLQEIWPVSVQVAATLTRRYLHAGQMDSKALDQQDALWAELAEAHAHLLDGGTDDPASLPEWVVAYRLMVSLSGRLMLAYLGYRSEPAGVWARLHRTYVACEQRNLLERDVTLTEQEGAVETPGLAYKRILLLGLANPSRLMYGEAATLYSYLTPFADKVKLEPVSEVAEAVPVVDLSGDSGPRILSGTAVPAGAICLRLGAVEAVLKAKLRQLERGFTDREVYRGGIGERLHRDMLLRLFHAWSQNRARVASRQSSDEPVTVAIGLRAAHYWISGEAAFEPESWERRLRLSGEEKKKGQFSLMPKPGEAAPDLISVAPDRDSSSVFAPDSMAIDASALAGFQAYQWQSRNRGDSGMQLYAPMEDWDQLRVGSLLAFRPSRKDAGEWRLGVLRWMQVEADQGVALGVERLADGVIPMAMRAVEGIGAGGEFMRCLRVLDRRHGGMTESLLVPAALYETGTLLLSVTRDRREHFRLVELLETTRMFSRFRFESL
jgi:hypothetical protein